MFWAYSVWYAIHVNFISSVFFGLMFNLKGPQGQNPRTTCGPRTTVCETLTYTFNHKTCSPAEGSPFICTPFFFVPKLDTRNKLWYSCNILPWNVISYSRSFYTSIKINNKESTALKKIRTANHNRTVSILASALAAADYVIRYYFW